jgi:hypothetical protein
MLNGKKMEENLSLVNNFQITSLKKRQQSWCYDQFDIHREKSLIIFK